MGPYTAAAVASIAFNDPSAVVDGNVIRVVSRLRALPGDPTKLGAVHTAKAQDMLQAERPGCFNQVGGGQCTQCLCGPRIDSIRWAVGRPILDFRWANAVPSEGGQCRLERSATQDSNRIACLRRRVTRCSHALAW